MIFFRDFSRKKRLKKLLTALNPDIALTLSDRAFSLYGDKVREEKTKNTTHRKKENIWHIKSKNRMTWCFPPKAQNGTNSRLIFPLSGTLKSRLCYST